MKTAFITGAAGFLGSHLVDEMLGSGYRVIGYDNLSHGNLRNLEQARLHPRFSFHQGDVCDRNAIRKAVGSKIDVVLHLAAFKIPRYGNVTDTLLINSDGTLNVLQLAVEHGAKFVITSTSDVYGKNPVVPFSEESDSILGPPTISRWAYAASKLFDEHLVLAMSFTFVSDTVRGIVAVTQADCLNREIINIGSNVEITILELAQEIHRLCGVPWKLRLQMLPYNQIAGRIYEDVRRRVPDIEKARRTLSFEAKVPLEEGLLKTIEWQRPFVLGQPERRKAEVLMIAEGVRG